MNPTINDNPAAVVPSPDKAKRHKGPHIKAGTTDSRRIAAVILEVLAGLRTPNQAAKALTVSLPRYYSIELTALQGLITACEPRRKGPGKNTDKQIETLNAQIGRLQSDLSRQQALIRSAQRAIGITAPTTEKTDGKRRAKKPTIRALKVAQMLRTADSETESHPVAALSDA